jgi:hypothetical protein
MSVIELPLKHFRARTATANASEIDRDGGMYGFGVINGASIITRGEALGHDLWVDADFLSDVTAAGNAKNFGLKARFTHPGLSSDGLGTYLGKVHNLRTEGDQVIGDLHFQESATKTPDGNLAEYVMQLAEDAPEDFGISIVFDHDAAASELHTLENTQGGRFVSPDEDNKNNYPHARLAQLRAADVVDSPAANPDGLFHREQQIAQDAEGLFEFAFGLSDERPTLQALSVDGDRIRAAVSRFLSRHNLSLIQEGEPMAEAVEQPEVPATPQVTREDFAAELQRYLTAFGQQGGEWFAAGKSFEDCQALQLAALREQVESLTAERDDLQARIAAVDLGENEPEEFGDGTTEERPQARNLGEGFANRIRINNGASRN